MPLAALPDARRLRRGPRGGMNPLDAAGADLYANEGRVEVRASEAIPPGFMRYRVRPDGADLLSENPD